MIDKSMEWAHSNRSQKFHNHKSSTSRPYDVTKLQTDSRSVWFNDIVTKLPQNDTIIDRKTRSATTKEAMDNQQQTLQRMQLTGAGDDDYEYESEDEMNDISDQGDGENQKQQKMVMIYGLGKPEDRPPPTYPPGDADKLYTDALLVYVKDFNQNIN